MAGKRPPRPRRPPVRRAPKRLRPGEGRLELFEIAADGALGTFKAPEAPRAVREARRAVPRAKAPPGRNLRALSIAPVKEDLPRMLPFTSSRVVMAGYSHTSHTLYVRFRDGTPWAYYNVEPNVWRNFRRSASPGRFINRVLNSYSYGRSNF